MALKDEVKEQRDKLKGKPIQEKISYYIDYYKWPGLISLVVAVFLIVFIVQYTNSPKKESLYGYFINANSSLYDASIGDDFSILMGIDEKKAPVLLETTDSLHLNASGYAIYGDETTSLKITALEQSSSLDFIVLDEAVFEYMALDGHCGNLEEILTTQDLERYQNRIYTYRYEGTDLSLGIIVTDSPILKKCDAYEEGKEVILCISPSAPHYDMTIAFIDYLLGP